MNRVETARILSIVRAVWSEATVNEETVSAWQWALEDVPYPLAEDALKQWIKTAKFAPRPGELLEIAARRCVGPNLLPETAWTEVMREVKRVGFGRPPVFQNGRFLPADEPTFSSPMISEAVAAVGWETICTSDKPEVVRAQFVKTLDAIVRRSITQVQTGQAVFPAVEGTSAPKAIDGKAAD